MALRRTRIRTLARRACCASAGPAARCSHGSRFATGSSPPRSTAGRSRWIAAAAASGACGAKVIVWSLIATASLVLVAVFGVPRIATRLAPLVPYALERRLGRADRSAGARKCSTPATPAPLSNAEIPPSEKPGRAAFDKLMSQLETAAALADSAPSARGAAAGSQRDRAARRIHLCLQGLIDKAETPDELAGVIAHEIGHVAHRDGTRSVLQAAGLSFLFGMLLGDFVGGGAVVFAAKTILQTSYSREVEAAADAYGVMLMSQDRRRSARARRDLCRASRARLIPGRKFCSTIRRPSDRVAVIEAMSAISADATAARPGRLGGAQEHLLEFVRRSRWRAAASTLSRPRGSPSGRGASPVLPLRRLLLAIIIVRVGSARNRAGARDFRRRAGDRRASPCCSRSPLSS